MWSDSGLIVGGTIGPLTNNTITGIDFDTILEIWVMLDIPCCLLIWP